MDILYLQGLRLPTIIGCLKWEQQMRQTVVVDLELAVDCQLISQTDAIVATLDYAQLTEQLITFASRQQCQLIETLAEKLAAFIHQHYPAIKQLKLSLEKPGALAQAKVGVIIERSYA